MVRTVLTPLSNDLHIVLQPEYVGKEIVVTYFSNEEISNLKVTNKRTLAKFRGALNFSNEKIEEFQKFIEDGRNERDI